MLGAPPRRPNPDLWIQYAELSASAITSIRRLRDKFAVAVATIASFTAAGLFYGQTRSS